MEIKNIFSVISSSKIKINNTPDNRLLFIDNIRWLMIVLVVVLHLMCTYGNIGMWYYQEPKVFDVLSKSLFGMFSSLTMAYSMGLLFFIAGFFVPGSYDKKGGGRFILNRFIRLGIPTLIFITFLQPITLLIKLAFQQCLPNGLISWYREYLGSYAFVSGPLWFALILLVFSTIYALFRLVFQKSKCGTSNKKSTMITHFRVLIVITLISLFAFAIKLVQPIGTSFYGIQLGNFSQYFLLFSLGVVTYRHNLLTRVSSDFGMFWFRLALFLGIPLWSLLICLGGALTDINPFMGGFNWQAAAYAIWESFFCVGICLGLLVLFRDRYNNESGLSRFLSENSFGVYVFHTPLLVGATMLVRGIIINPLIKMILMSIIMIPVCFGFSYLIRKVPPLKKLFS